MASKLELEISEFVGAFGDLYSSEQKDFLFKHILEWEDSSGKETGMKWVKASERLPEKNYNYFVRVFYFNDPKQGTYNAASFWDGKQFIDALRTNYGQPVPLVVSEWLDESGQQTNSESNEAVELTMRHILTYSDNVDWIIKEFQKHFSITRKQSQS